MPFRTRALAASAGVVLAAALLAGCTDASREGLNPNPAPTAAAEDSPLHPVYPDDFSAATAGPETVRVADEVQSLIDPSDIVHVDDHAQEVPADADGAAYFGVIRTLTLTPTVDPIAQARTIGAGLKAAGWVERDVVDEEGSYFAALSSVAKGKKSWFIVVGGDTSVAGQSVVSVQLASPDLT